MQSYQQRTLLSVLLICSYSYLLPLMLSPRIIVVSQCRLQVDKGLSKVIGRLRIVGINWIYLCLILVHFQTCIRPSIFQSLSKRIPLESLVLLHISPSFLHNGASVIFAIYYQSVISCFHNFYF
nr:MAG TPA: hypothetical protein [Bacteriophage sp.]